MKKQSWKYYKNNVIILFRNKIITFLINKIINQYLSLSLSLSLSLYIYIYIYIYGQTQAFILFFFFFLNWMEIHCLLVAFWSAQLVEKLPRYQVTTLWIKKKKETCFQPIFKWKCFRNTPKFSFNPYLTSKQFLISQNFQNSSRLKKKTQSPIYFH